MREAKGPVTTKEVALHVMRQRGLNTGDVAALALFARRSRALLYHYQERGESALFVATRKVVAGSIGGNLQFNRYARR